jgi:hypothetical protein
MWAIACDKRCKLSVLRLARRSLNPAQSLQINARPLVQYVDTQLGHTAASIVLIGGLSFQPLALRLLGHPPQYVARHSFAQTANALATFAAIPFVIAVGLHSR